MRLLPIALFMSILFSQTATPPTLGDGSIGNPYQIATLENLYWLSQQGGVVNATSTYWEKHYMQTADIDASTTTTWGSGNGNSGWTPIGTFGENFTGSYNGQNYSVSYLYINRWAEGGLFGYLGLSANIENVNLSFINLISPNYSGGAIASYNNGTITNCSATGTITTQRFPGGLVGHNDGTISNSNTTVAVTATGDGFSTFNGPGGFVGENDGTINNCYSTDLVSGWGSAGGFVHVNSFSGNITNCYSIGVVSGGTDSGGFVGINDGYINACYCTGHVTSGGERVGGFVGDARDSGSGNITNCYSLGNVTRNSGSSNTSYGAFTGRANGTVAYCYSIGSVIYTDTSDPTDKGFVGLDNTGSYSNNFWDGGTSNQTTATGATKKTTAQMKSHHTFTDYIDGTDGLELPVWDFITNPNDDVANNNYWDIDYSSPIITKVRSINKIFAINDSYPFLDYQNGEDIALPVELSSFIVESTLEGVQCLWITESEFENLGFILEKKIIGENWIEIASYKTDHGLRGQGTTSLPTDYNFMDRLVIPYTTYEYRLSDVDYDGVITHHLIRKITIRKESLSFSIDKFNILPAYPNPFNPITTITYGLDKDSKVTVTIYDITGNIITTLLNTEQKQGWHSLEWNGNDLNNKQVPAGVYIGRVTSNDEFQTIKLMLLK